VDVPEREFSTITSLNRQGGRYLIIGGYAMLFHAYEERLLDDLDIWIDDSTGETWGNITAGSQSGEGFDIHSQTACKLRSVGLGALTLRISGQFWSIETMKKSQQSKV
jgi:hypothetical protein